VLETVAMPAGMSGLFVRGVNVNGYVANHPNWNPDERVRVVPTGGPALQAEDYSHFEGFDFDGVNAGGVNGIEKRSGFVGDPSVWLEDCIAHDFAKLGVDIRGDDTVVERTTIFDCGDWGLYVGTAADIVVAAVLIYGCGSGLFAWGGGKVAHLTVADCTSTNYAAIDLRNGTVKVANSLAFDNRQQYGFANQASAEVIYTTSHSSDPGTYHTTGNFENLSGPATVHLSESNPSLDAELRPQDGGSAYLTGFGPTDIDKDADRRSFASPRPSRGALESIGSDVAVVDEGETIWSSDGVGEPVHTAARFEPMKLDRQTLRAAALAAMHSDARAKEDDPEVPGGWAADRRGWWGDKVHGIEFGSRLWLLDRSVMVDETVARAEQYLEDSQQWLVDQRIATEVYAEAERVDSKIAADIVADRDEKGGEELDLRFDDIWGDLYA